VTRHRVGSSSRNSLSVQSLVCANGTARMGQAVPLCRWPFPRLCGFPAPQSAGCRSSDLRDPLFGFRVPPESYPVTPGRKATARRHLSWTLAPFSTCRNRRSTSLRAMPDPLCFASRVWLPSWRLAPFGPWPVLFHTGSTHGIHPSKSSSCRVSERCRPKAPTCRFPCRCSRCRNVGPARQAAASGLCPRQKCHATLWV
jgi:hypothetical protein